MIVGHARLPLTDSAPPFTDVDPENELAPPRTKVPIPVLVSPPLLKTPLTEAAPTVALPPPTWIVKVPVRAAPARTVSAVVGRSSLFKMSVPLVGRLVVLGKVKVAPRLATLAPLLSVMLLLLS